MAAASVQVTDHVVNGAPRGHTRPDTSIEPAVTELNSLRHSRRGHDRYARRAEVGVERERGLYGRLRHDAEAHLVDK